MYTTVKGTLINFTYAVDRPLPNAYIPRGYGVERGVQTYRDGETLFLFHHVERVGSHGCTVLLPYTRRYSLSSVLVGRG